MRNRTTANQVDEYLDTLPDEKRALAEVVRQIILAAVPHQEECVRWDLPCYFFHGPVCYFAASRSGIHLGFFRGKELPDPEKRLVSRDGQPPHIKIKSMQDIQSAYFTELVRAAVTLNRT